MALAASVVVAVSLILFQDQRAPMNTQDMTPADNSETLAVQDDLNEKPDITKTVQSGAELSLQRPLVQQRVTPDNIVNDVKKLTFEKRQPLAATNDQSKLKSSELKQEPAEVAQQAPFEIPAHINELLQNTSTGDQKLNGMPPAEVLRNWQRPQWVDQVTLLNKQGKRELAEQYVQVFPEYFPGDSIKYLIKP